MEVSIEQVNLRLQQIREDFLSKRAKQEVRINAWGEKISKVNKEILEGIELPEEITLKALVPELYAENPREEVYLEQLQKANDLITKVNEVAAKHVNEAYNKLKEYQSFSA